MFKKNSKGFTLIELLVVIAIIGILSSVVLASLNSARKKGRDTRRVADIQQLQLALELEFDKSRTYPATLATLVTSGFISVIPTDPIGSTAYPYFLCNSTAYHLGAALEESNSAALSADLNAVPTACSLSTLTGSNDATQATTACVANVTGGRYCYDVTP